MNPPAPTKTRLRRSFTLVEILVVITIIGILATITLGVVGGLLGQARDAATKATLSKLQGLVNQRAQAIDRLMKRARMLENSQEYNDAYSQFNGNAALQRVVARKMIIARYFPQHAGETTYNSKLYPAGSNILSATPPEVFFYALTQISAGDSPVALDTFSASEMRVRDNNGQPATSFIDAWGNPIRFYRWPTRLFRSGGQTGLTTVAPITTADIQNATGLFVNLPSFSGNLSQDLARDPDDPLQTCLTSMPAGVQFENYVFSGSNVRLHTPATYHVFLVISAGPDGVLGLFEPDDFSNNGHLGAVKNLNDLSDDIVSLSIRAGGK